MSNSTAFAASCSFTPARIRAPWRPRKGLGRAPLPDARARKYPNPDRQWVWQWVFPASSHYLDRGTGLQHRHHQHESIIQKASGRLPAAPASPSA